MKTRENHTGSFGLGADYKPALKTQIKIDFRDKCFFYPNIRKLYPLVHGPVKFFLKILFLKDTVL